MKTVKRKANVGEYIQFTTVGIGKVDWIDDEVMCVTVGNKAQILAHDEYEVIIENEEANEMGVIEKMQAEIDDLKAKVAALEGAKVSVRKAGERTYRAMTEDKLTSLLKSAKTPQQIRDGIVARAKADVADLKLVYLRYTCGEEFIVNKEKRSVVVLLRGRYTNGIHAKGIAKADPSDCFNVHIGKAIALRRALGLEVPAEYYNAPQPTEVRVGDIMSPTDAIHTQRHKVVESLKIDMRRGVITLEDARYYVGKSLGKIIDDSREEE